MFGFVPAVQGPLSITLSCPLSNGQEIECHYSMSKIEISFNFCAKIMFLRQNKAENPFDKKAVFINHKLSNKSHIFEHFSQEDVMLMALMKE